MEKGVFHDCHIHKGGFLLWIRQLRRTEMGIVFGYSSLIQKVNLRYMEYFGNESLNKPNWSVLSR